MFIRRASTEGMNGGPRRGGFTLPSVIIVSVIMLSFLMMTLQIVRTTSGSLRTQQYQQLASEAAEAGIVFTRHCIEGGTTGWSQPLRPGGTCTGLAAQCTANNCWLVNREGIRTTFSVAPSADGSEVEAVGRVELLRRGTVTVRQTVARTLKSAATTAGSAGSSAVWSQISSGIGHTCSIGAGQRAYCWGANFYGQVGNNATVDAPYPVAVNTQGVMAGKLISQISAGGVSACALSTDYRVYCWGRNNYGQLGNNSTAELSSVPVEVQMTSPSALNGLTVRQIDAGALHVCAVASNNRAYCWGDHTRAQLGHGAPNTGGAHSRVAVAVRANTGDALAGKSIRQISAGSFHTCAVTTENRAYCWGLNNYGQLGTGSTAVVWQTTPVEVSSISGRTIKYIEAEGERTCAITSDDRIYCWGRNDDGYGSGQLGDGTTIHRSVPTPVLTSGVLSGKAISHVSASSAGTCAVSSDGMAFCWGTAPQPAFFPGSELDGKAVRAISAGTTHYCVLATDSTVYCWGSNMEGQLGNGGNPTMSAFPVRVQFPPGSPATGPPLHY